MGASPFAPWAVFYQTTGSAAAALTGLMFIVVTLAANRPRKTGEHASEMAAGFSAFSTPTMVHLSAAFLISAGLTVPWRTAMPIAVLLAIGGIIGVMYMVRIHRRVRTLTTYVAPIEDVIWYSILPFFAYLLLVTGAFALVWLAAAAPLMLAVVTLLLILIGIHNAWDIVTYLGMSSADP